MLLNRVSMYQLVNLSLFSLWILGWLFTLTGGIDFSPVAYVVSLPLLMAATFLSNRLFGLLFGVRPHDDSSYITSFILFFIFTPTLELSGLLALALTGVIASASKYLLAYRGRHIFNPAALAAFVISLLELTYATWWIATPPMLALTSVLAFLVLYKTRRLQMGLLFLAVAVPLVLVTLAGYNVDFNASLSLLAAWPFLYFVGFMLSEPLTLPPKKWQQFIVAAVVAFLFAVPVDIGEYTTTFAVALLVGNLVAFSFSRRQAIKLTYIGSTELTASTHEFSFTPTKKISYEPGQYMELTLPHKQKDGRGQRRIFSMTSAPHEPTIRFGIKFYEPSSSFKSALLALPPQAVITATGINGSFVLPKDTAQPLLFIAGGIGITPFISHLLAMHEHNEKRDVILLYSVSSPKEIAYAVLLKKLGVRVILVTETSAQSVNPNWQVYDQARITKNLMEQAVPDIAKRAVYVSGPPLMITGITRSLKKLGVKRIKTDYFTGY